MLTGQSSSIKARIEFLTIGVGIVAAVAGDGLIESSWSGFSAEGVQRAT